MALNHGYEQYGLFRFDKKRKFAAQAAQRRKLLVLRFAMPLPNVNRMSAIILDVVDHSPNKQCSSLSVFLKPYWQLASPEPVCL